MAYDLGNELVVERWKSEIVVVNTKQAYVGYRAYARMKNGNYKEVFDLGQEQLWVDGTNQGAWTRGTHETEQDAVKKASMAFNWMNK